MIKSNISQIKERIALICAKIKRDPATITLVAVSKNRTLEQMKEAIDDSISDIGENKVQEALIKYNAISNTQYAKRIKWHLVGHLQTNKAKDAVEIFDLIHSVDSLRLAREIDKQAVKINKVQDILIEVKTSPEEAKSGLQPEEAIGVIKEISVLKNIRILGVMTIAPLVDVPEKARPYFRRLKELLVEINQSCPLSPVPCTLSMGMTNDFEIAIEEGSNMLRIGRAIFV